MTQEQSELLKALETHKVENRKTRSDLRSITNAMHLTKTDEEKLSLFPSILKRLETVEEELFDRIERDWEKYQEIWRPEGLGLYPKRRRTRTLPEKENNTK